MFDAANPCPCGTGETYGACCERWLAGAPAPTALALMRSRYTAYVVGAIDYLVETHDEASRAQVDVAATTAWSRETSWQGLEILDVVAGGEGDREGVVEFIARGVTRGTPFAQRERSRFRRAEDRWTYVDGEARQAPVRKAATQGRNELCACGSGRKFKRCHGA
ncbi:MAG: YchJ family protein [Kofleriaceae bacterium]